MLKVTNSNYCATIIKLPPKQKVEGLDKLVRVTQFGNDVLVGLDEPEDELYIFFPAECKIDAKFLHYNNLFREQQLNYEAGKKGFFENNGRVKAIKFKGVISTGFIIPASSLSVDGMNLDGLGLKIGDEFNEINDQLICEKYVRKYNNQQALGGGEKKAKINNKLQNLMVPHQFRFHEETNQLAKNLHHLNLDDIVVITDKWHGSSCILSKVYVRKSLNIWQKFLNLIGGQVPDKKYGYIYASGKPKSNLPKGIEGEWINNGQTFYVSNIWKRAFDDNKAKIEDGISIYGELVGYTDGGAAIQRKYDYECKPFDYRLMVYRITHTREDGTKIEFSWQQIKNYCTKYGLEHVKELKFGRWGDILAYLPIDGGLPIEIQREEFFNNLASTLERECPHCTTGVPSEGVVVRIDGKDSFMAFKIKSKAFLKHETDEIDKGAVDIEEEANNA